jgi:hypothetical protein
MSDDEGNTRENAAGCMPAAVRIRIFRGCIQGRALSVR